MRTLLRLAAILLVTGAVAGGIYLAVRSSPSDVGREAAGQRDRAWSDHESAVPTGDSGVRGGEGARPRRGRWAGGERRAERGGREGLESRDGGEGRGGHGEFSPGRGSAGLLFTTLQVGVVVAVVAGLQGRSRRKAKKEKAESEPIR